MINHAQRFSMPPGFAAIGNSQTGFAAHPVAQVQQSPAAMLAQIYALAQQRAAAAVQHRRWQFLLQQLLELKS